MSGGGRYPDGEISEEDQEAAKAAWLCAECYGRYHIAGFFNGQTTKLTTKLSRNITINVSCIDADGVTTMSLPTPFLRRAHTKETSWDNAWFDPHGIIFDGPIDTSFASYWGDIAGDCWGNTEKTFKGEYSSLIQYENSEIYYADLREDILVYYHESGSQNTSADGDEPIGEALAYAFWNGAEKATCRGVDIKDAIKLPLNFSQSAVRKELITLGSYIPYNESAVNQVEVNAAIGDIFMSVNDFAVIDSSKPYNCEEGVYVELVEHEQLHGYRNSWESFGLFTDIDDYDESIWYASFKATGVDHIPNGTMPYPSFVGASTLPKGSFATDAAGNYFHSMITKDMKTFNKLNATDPNTAASLEGGGIVYYPIAPA